MPVALTIAAILWRATRLLWSLFLSREPSGHASGHRKSWSGQSWSRCWLVIGAVSQVHLSICPVRKHIISTAVQGFCCAWPRQNPIQAPLPYIILSTVFSHHSSACTHALTRMIIHCQISDALKGYIAWGVKPRFFRRLSCCWLIPELLCLRFTVL